MSDISSQVQTYFSKQDPTEKLSRLSLLGNSQGLVTIWLKGTKDKYDYRVSKFDKERVEIVLDTKDSIFKDGTLVLCTFELRGMNFFSEVIFKKSVSDFAVLQVPNILFKSERRSSYRLMTYPMHEVYAEFNLGEAYEGGKVIDLKSRNSQTGLFKNFLKIVDSHKSEGDESERLRIRVQDLSTTGMALHVTELEQKFFQKGLIFQKVNIRFTDSVITIPEVKVMYVVDFISGEKKVKKYKLGIHFENLPPSLDDTIGKKINLLLRENDFNKDFENFIK